MEQVRNRQNTHLRSEFTPFAKFLALGITPLDSDHAECCRMDYIRKYDIELEKEQYYAGEILRGWVVIENAENLRITGMLFTDVRVRQIVVVVLKE